MSEQYRYLGRICNINHFHNCCNKPVGVFVFLLIVLTTSAIMAETSQKQVTRGNAIFTNELYKTLSKTEGNVFFSPISVHAALSMAFQGAGEGTAEALAKALQVPNEAKTVAEGYESIITRLNNVENITLLMANKLFLHNSAKLLDNFNTALSKHFLSELQKVDFAKNTEAARTINSWVEQKTKNKIKDLIQPDDLNALTRLVLVNAIYFKGDWAKKFDKKSTRTEPFYLNDNDKIDAEMMHLTSKFNYKEDSDLKAQVLELPYVNRDLSLVIILPNERNGIKELETKLATVDLSNITNNMWETKVNVALPKFKIETMMDLEQPLTDLGLGVIFDRTQANFRGMIELKDDENLYVSKVVQKAFIEVNEEGAEAAAATGVVIRTFHSALVELTYNFSAEHPFIFVIIDKAQQLSPNVLFAGRIKRL